MATLMEALMSVVQQNQQLAKLNQKKMDNAIRELQAQVGQPSHQQFHPQQQPQNQRSNMEELLTSFMQKTEGAVKDLQTQVGSMTEEINQLHAQNGEKLPSQPTNPSEGVSAITMGSGNNLYNPKLLIRVKKKPQWNQFWRKRMQIFPKLLR
ncbi:uncharacterized protein LOC113341837 [Papaver somniferum]|uniref:uncharacterized protein LOC113341837 n=1 Tax=Papaver somniferum TaxID=3469 RepID=UPI000E6F495B|nr:uncharacterized protein LOC113341837 [Papaver somniferum]